VSVRDGRIVMVVLAGLAVALLALAGMSAWHGAARLIGRGTDRARAVAVARAFAEAYGTFDYRYPDAHRARLAELTVGSLHDAVVSAAPDPTAVAQQHRAAVRAVSAQLTALARSDATVVITAVRRLQGMDPATGRPLAIDVEQRLVCRLVRADGSWRVIEVRVVAEPPRVTRPERVGAKEQVG
jgi:hypothetical protein